MKESFLSTLDGPFGVQDLDLEPSRPPTEFRPVTTPRGQELVPLDYDDEVTVIMTAAERDPLVAETRQDRHTRPTVRSMPAVRPPSSRRTPIVSVVDADGNEVTP